MTEELKDLECMKTLGRFCYIDGDKSMPESEQDSVVFTIHDGDGKCRDEVLPYLYFYARELGIANFGRCYHRFMMEIDLHDFYKTEDYGKKIR